MWVAQYVTMRVFFSGDDSWGEEESDEEDYPSYPHLPYAYPGSRLPMPVVMYPMILPPQPVPRKSKGTNKQIVTCLHVSIYYCCITACFMIVCNIMIFCMNLVCAAN